MMYRSLISLLIVVPLLPSVGGCENGGAKKEVAAETTLAKEQLSSPANRQGDPLYAYVDAMRADLSDGKALLINRVMRLSPEESSKFWPIYHDYEDELFALGDQRVEMTRKFVTALGDQSLDDRRSDELANEWFQFETRRLELLKKYHRLIGEELSPIRAAQFTQIEHRVGTVVDALIASELPLVRTTTARGR